MTFKDPIQFKPFCHSMVHGAIPCFRQVVLVKHVSPLGSTGVSWPFHLQASVLLRYLR